ncbi:hypothetical protein C8Q76DRAFT_326171 [Earliella scabrosa]|nr:hypothetical protein C8Q76DRAFT_326171 [Earliella scabrosa]
MMHVRPAEVGRCDRRYPSYSALALAASLPFPLRSTQPTSSCIMIFNSLYAITLLLPLVNVYAQSGSTTAPPPQTTGVTPCLFQCVAQAQNSSTSGSCNPSDTSPTPENIVNCVCPNIQQILNCAQSSCSDAEVQAIQSVQPLCPSGSATNGSSTAPPNANTGNAATALNPAALGLEHGGVVRCLGLALVGVVAGAAIL